ncbi:hypothetical protein PMIT1318_00633 [Prochlorococcus marinus str. MIT 1318]|uniref:hypothetical protein n=1 Tax=Prochlorococcus TaxID=1218 RepID=UPI0007B3FAE1|nr:hypothetical protein [Prochlorococcus marinus]KZR73045.1 hypothetical protein PMIT1318_00633 [Prochlorococcus marinus str. MIT 1318]
MTRNQLRPNVGQQLKVIQPSLHESLLLQQQELQAQQPLSINKSQNRRSKPTAKPKVKSNSLEAPYKTPQAKPRKPTQQKKVKPQVKQLTLEVEKKSSLAKQKREMVEWLENVQIN